MESTDRTLLRLHVEAVWDVRLPSLVLNDVELLPDGSQPSWKLCVAEQATGRVYMWRPDVTSMEREAVLATWSIRSKIEPQKLSLAWFQSILTFIDEEAV
jgi:hypothetical protein